MDLGDALVSAASCLPPDPILPTPEVCHTMCEIILAGFQYSFVVNPQTLWTYFGLRLKKAREYHVGRATRLLLGCGAFMAHAVGADVRIRPVLVAGVMLHLPAEVGYLFIIRACFYPVHVSVSPSYSRPFNERHATLGAHAMLTCTYIASPWSIPGIFVFSADGLLLGAVFSP